jgi:hypothetical protein
VWDNGPFEINKRSTRLPIRDRGSPMKASTVDLIRTSDQESGLHVIHLPVGWKVTRESIDLWARKNSRGRTCPSCPKWETDRPDPFSSASLPVEERKWGGVIEVSWLSSWICTLLFVSFGAPYLSCNDMMAPPLATSSAGVRAPTLPTMELPPPVPLLGAPSLCIWCPWGEGP